MALNGTGSRHPAIVMEKKLYEYTLMGRSGGEGIELPILLKKGDRFIYDDIVYIVVNFYSEDGLYCEREYILKDDFYDAINNFCKSINNIVEHGNLLKIEDISNEIRNFLDCYCASDRESEIDKQSGIRNNYSKIHETLRKLSNKTS
jgi:hypothetical protein